MPPDAHDALETLVRLGPAERAEAVARLLASFDGVPERDASSAWDDELARRISELKAGTVAPVSLEEARRRIHADD